MRQTTKIPAFSSLPQYVQDDLTEWYNVREPDAADKRRLVKLYAEGRFHAWHCPTCGERVRSGDPEDWGHFQGVLEPDYSSYPGDHELHTPETIVRQCVDCRTSVVRTPPEVEYPEY